MPESQPLAGPKPAPPPLPFNRLKQICTDACKAQFANVEQYEHSRTEGWNTGIINNILRSLTSETTQAASPSAATHSCPYKFAVNSTIIQHLSQKTSGSSEGTGRRGVHSACGAFWNNEKDGMWSFKHEAPGMDVVISITWIAV